jgi:glycerol-3-phosphate dehydrogenase
MTSKASQSLSIDVAIFGAGVAGLWLLNRLRKWGYSVLLLEPEALGAGQTRYAQGIIHGGTKYALSGKLTDSSDAVARMPAIWRACLEGGGEIDLSKVELLSSHQYLWSTTSLTSRMAGFFASKLMRSRTAVTDAAERPPLFRDERFHGQVYRLDEPVLDTASLVRALATPHLDAILKFDAGTGLKLDPEQPGKMALINGDDTLQLDAKCVVLAAGKGNGELLAQLGRARPTMQLRPLHMVMVRGMLPEAIYAHCLGASTNPRITISTHRDASGETVWYLGGQLAEEGVRRDAATQIAAAQHELQQLFPWVDFSECQWATLPIDRAEVRMSDGSRPADPFAEFDNGVITVWPTKLAMAPRLAERIEALLEEQAISPSGGDQPSPEWPHPAIAPLPWQEEERWHSSAIT